MQWIIVVANTVLVLTYHVYHYYCMVTCALIILSLYMCISHVNLLHVCIEYLLVITGITIDKDDVINNLIM